LTHLYPPKSNSWLRLWLVLSQYDQRQIHHLVHQLAQAGVVRIIFFMAISVWCLETPVKEFTKETQLLKTVGD